MGDDAHPDRPATPEPEPLPTRPAPPRAGDGSNPPSPPAKRAVKKAPTAKKTAAVKKKAAAKKTSAAKKKSAAKKTAAAKKPAAASKAAAVTKPAGARKAGPARVAGRAVTAVAVTGVTGSADIPVEDRRTPAPRVAVTGPTEQGDVPVADRHVGAPSPSPAMTEWSAGRRPGTAGAGPDPRHGHGDHEGVRANAVALGALVGFVVLALLWRRRRRH